MTAPPAAVLTALSCRAEVATRTVACGPAAGPELGSGARAALVTVGGQHRYVRLTSGTPVFTAADSTFAFTVTVQNLLLVPLGTGDGATPDAGGVRVFFSAGPSGNATVKNPSGTDAFTASDQPYFQYSGAELGGDGILSPDEVSASKEWQIDTNGETAFTFLLLMQSRYPTGRDPTAHFTQVSAGGAHKCGLTAAGAAYCWGSDAGGALGNGAALTASLGVPSPVDMSTLPAGVTFTQISAGSFHNCALGTDGRGYCWGFDGSAALGNGAALTANQESPSPVDMSTLPAGVTFTRISAGNSHTCAVGTDGKGYCWGSDANGLLGNGAAITAPQHSPSPVDMSTLPAGVTFTRISAGGGFVCAVASNGGAYCWGPDLAGRLGNGAAVTAEQHSPAPADMSGLPAGVTFTDISSGNLHTCALGSNGHGYCWGNDNSQEVGDGYQPPISQRHTPTPVDMGVLPAGVTFTQITAGNSFTCALGTDGIGYCWGNDASSGKLGNGAAATDNVEVPSPMEMPAGVQFTAIHAGFSAGAGCAIAAEGVYCWGTNPSRQVGDGTATTRHSPVAVAGTR